MFTACETKALLQNDASEICGNVALPVVKFPRHLHCDRNNVKSKGPTKYVRTFYAGITFLTTVFLRIEGTA